VRVCAGTLLQPGKAAFAAFTASSTSLAAPMGTLPRRSPVAGFVMATYSGFAEAFHCPPM
jgi:hypothetical protein